MNANVFVTDSSVHGALHVLCAPAREVDSVYPIRYTTCVRVRFYVTAAGASPVEKYLAGLDSKERAVVLDTLTALEEEGLGAAGVTTRQLAGKLWELKAPQQRVFYVVLTGPEMVLLHACKKQGQKARAGDISLAEKRMKEELR